MPMEKAIVTFNNPDNNQNIKIFFEYDQETSDLHYNIELDETIDMMKPLDLSGFLAKTLLEFLKQDNTEEQK